MCVLLRSIYLTGIRLDLRWLPSESTALMGLFIALTVTPATVHTLRVASLSCLTHRTTGLPTIHTSTCVPRPWKWKQTVSETPSLCSVTLEKVLDQDVRILVVKNLKKVALNRDEWAQLLKKARAHQRLSSQWWWWWWWWYWKTFWYILMCSIFRAWIRSKIYKQSTKCTPIFFMYFIHSVLTNMFRSAFRPSSGRCCYYKNINIQSCK